VKQGCIIFEGMFLFLKIWICFSLVERQNARLKGKKLWLVFLYIACVMDGCLRRDLSCDLIPALDYLENIMRLIYETIVV
jgi:hypothetical protein